MNLKVLKQSVSTVFWCDKLSVNAFVTRDWAVNRVVLEDDALLSPGQIGSSET